MYGGTLRSNDRQNRGEGLSPRVRGNLAECSAHTRPRRSIPACTGEPEHPIDVLDRSAVYPRVYGGTGASQHFPRMGNGLSPRVRGNLPSLCVSIGKGRSIPACTGEPQCDVLHVGKSQVYPRVYGGTDVWFLPQDHSYGLSPRVRGNLHRCVLCPQRQNNRQVCRQFRRFCSSGPPWCGRLDVPEGSLGCQRAIRLGRYWRDVTGSHRRGLPAQRAVLQ